MEKFHHKKHCGITSNQNSDLKITRMENRSLIDKLRASIRVIFYLQFFPLSGHVSENSLHFDT
jgi:hypothetical protein